MAMWKELLALAFFVGTVSSQAQGFLSAGSTNMFGHRPQFGTTGFSGFGSSLTSFGHSGATSFRPSSGLRSGSRSVSPDVSSQDPPEIRRLLGSTIHGRELRMGELGLPRHGGAGAGPRHASGLLRGWDGNPQTLGNQFVDTWRDPFGGGPIPPSFFGTGMMGRPFL